MLVTTDHLELNYTNSDDLTIDYYREPDIDNMLLSYSTGSHVDCNLANKVSTSGDAAISGNLDVGSGTSSRIRSHASASGYTGYSELNTASSWDLWINLETTYPSGGWMYFKINIDSYMRLSGSDNKVNIHKDTSVDGNLDVGKVLTLKRVPGVSDTRPLVIVNDSPGGGTGVVYQSTASGQGFIIAYVAAQSSVAWGSGVNWGGANEFVIKSGSNGLTIKPTGDVAISGNLDVNVSNAPSSAKAYNTTEGYTSYIELEAK